jgi:hypothetical protein
MAMSGTEAVSEKATALRKAAIAKAQLNDALPLR